MKLLTLRSLMLLLISLLVLSTLRMRQSWQFKMLLKLPKVQNKQLMRLKRLSSRLLLLRIMAKRLLTKSMLPWLSPQLVV